MDYKIKIYKIIYPKENNHEIHQMLNYKLIMIVKI